MALKYIIDGYNLINNPEVSSRRKKAQDHRQALVDLIRFNRLCGSSRNTATVVFDGGYAGNAVIAVSQDISAVFSCDEEADAVIVRMVQRSTQPANIRVVSDDKQIRILARAYRAKAVSVEEFLKPISRETERKKSRAVESDPQLNYSQVEEINRELRDLWLK